ncbi:MAG TPA: acyl-CoA dehydrogenase family protein, partial [Thermoanaerobaculia bacterium]|nr:acyl-CoA dehydrogenase family protein [Thermoanaerobaculia bacterium]
MAAPAPVSPAHPPGFGFALTEEQEAVRAMVRDFARTEIAPRVKEWDEAQVFPRDVMAKLGELGMLGVLVPEEFGGAGLTYVDYIHVVDELSRVDGSIGLSVAAHNSLGTNHIWLFGDDAQKRKWVPPLAQGKLLAAWGLTEAEAGSDSAGTKTTAVKDGATWVLNGSKNFITHGSVGDVAVLMAVTDKAAGPRGISAFVVDLHQKGIHSGKKENKLGMRASDTATLVMEDCRVPAENLLGAPGEGFLQAMKVLDGGRISIAALSLGIAEGAFEGARAYAQQRRQ